MCAEGMVCIAIFALAREPFGHSMRTGTGIHCGSGVATCSTAKSWKKKLSRPFHGSMMGRKTTHAAKLQNTPVERCVGRAHYVMNVCSRHVA